jgi:hypothetical protein
MNEKQKSQLVKEAEALRDFFKEWWTVEQLYEAEAKAALALLHLKELAIKVLCDDEVKALHDALNQHMIMVEHLKPFAEEEGGEV